MLENKFIQKQLFKIIYILLIQKIKIVNPIFIDFNYFKMYLK